VIPNNFKNAPTPFAESWPNSNCSIKGESEVKRRRRTEGSYVIHRRKASAK